MPARPILLADDINNQTDSGKKRSQTIRDAASLLARRLKTKIDFLFVEDAKTYPVDELGLFRFPEWHDQHEKRIGEAVGQFAVQVSCSLKSGTPAEQILRVLRSRSAPELVVVGTQGRKGLKRLLIGSVAEEVIRHSRRPVMVIGPAARELNRDVFGHKHWKILVPTDLGKNSRAAEQYALSLAKRIGARITLYHCLWDTINAIIVNAAYSGMAAYNLDAVIADSHDNAVESMKRKAGLFQKHGVSCDFKVEEISRPSLCAVHEEAERGYSIVIMGTHGRNAVLNAFFGSTARETILNSPIPVIVVHSGR